MREMKFYEAIRDGLIEAMRISDSVICYGLGVTDPKGVFGTTIGLEDEFGHKRVFDMPTSENAMTGVAIGASLNGIRPVLTHQRCDFALLAMDQLINGAAKWNYMFGGNNPIPIVIRLIIGRGWGQGPTHSQNLQALFAHIPGLKVVMPSTAEDAKGLLLSAIFDENPVIFMEHRWLHNSVGKVPAGDHRVPIGLAKKIRSGEEVTVVSMGYMTIEAIRALDFLRENKIFCDLIDLRSIKPIDWNSIYTSIEKTGRLLVLDSGFTTGSVAGEIVAKVAMEKFSFLTCPPIRLAMPDISEPTSYGLTKGFYVNAFDIALAVIKLLNRKVDINIEDLSEKSPHDIPGPWFSGPF